MQFCVQIRDCNGVTKVKDNYEFRSGKVLSPSEVGEESWIKKNLVPQANDKLYYTDTEDNNQAVGSIIETITSNSSVPSSQKKNYEVPTQIGNQPPLTWTYSNGTYLLGYPKSVSMQNAR